MMMNYIHALLIQEFNFNFIKTKKDTNKFIGSYVFFIVESSLLALDK